MSNLCSRDLRPGQVYDATARALRSRSGPPLEHRSHALLLLHTFYEASACAWRVSLVSLCPSRGAGASQRRRATLTVVICRPVGRSRQPRRSQRDPRSSSPSRWWTLGGSRRWSGAPLRAHHAGHRRRVPLVRHDDPDLHAGREDAAAVRDALRRDRRRDGDRDQRAHAGTPYTFSFTTPTVKLLQTDGLSPRRPGRRAVRRPACGSTSAVRPGDVAGAVVGAVRAVTTGRRRRFRPTARQRLAADRPARRSRAFNAKVAATNAAASSNAPVTLRLTNDWDKKRYPPARTLVAFETVTACRPQSCVR